MSQIGLDEVFEFLGIVAARGTWNDNTVQARRTACNKFFDILDEGEKSVEYVRDNLDVIKARYMNLNKSAAGATVDEYGRRVLLVLTEFAEWKSDRSVWERKHAAKQTARPTGEEKKPRAAKAEKKEQEQPASNSTASTNDPSLRTVEIPLRNGEAKIVIPRDISMADVKRIAWGLMTFATDFDPEVSPRDPFPMLGQQRGGAEYRDQ